MVAPPVKRGAAGSGTAEKVMPDRRIGEKPLKRPLLATSQYKYVTSGLRPESVKDVALGAVKPRPIQPRTGSHR